MKIEEIELDHSCGLKIDIPSLSRESFLKEFETIKLAIFAWAKKHGAKASTLYFTISAPNSMDARLALGTILMEHKGSGPLSEVLRRLAITVYSTVAGTTETFIATTISGEFVVSML